MTSIKCKYMRYRCIDGTYAHNGQICNHHVSFGGEYDESCEYGDGARRFPELLWICSNACEEIVMFEKNVKSFELNWDYLTLRGQKIDTDKIKYLAIDGEVIIDDGGE